ncbi:MAG: ABC transporter substrate-binding protein, partial [Rhizobiaceae bacterium]
MKKLLLCLCLIAAPHLAVAEVLMFPALSGNKDAPVLTVYSSLDEPLAKPMITGFQSSNPDVAVSYEDMLTGEIYD